MPVLHIKMGIINIASFAMEEPLEYEKKA